MNPESDPNTARDKHNLKQKVNSKKDEDHAGAITPVSRRYIRIKAANRELRAYILMDVNKSVIRPALIGVGRGCNPPKSVIIQMTFEAPVAIRHEIIPFEGFFNVDIILGSDFVHQCKVTFNYRENIVNILGHAVPMYIEDTSTLMKNKQGKVMLRAPHAVVEKCANLCARKTSLYKKEIDRLLKARVIRASQSPWCSPADLIIAEAGQGKPPRIKIDVDYSEINTLIHRECNRLPNIQDVVQYLDGLRWFSVLHLVDATECIKLPEQETPKTAFMTPMGLYEFRSLPPGIQNAGFVLQRALLGLVGELVPYSCAVYMEYILVYTKEREGHHELVKKIINRLLPYFKYTIQKCQVCLQKVNFMGYLISEQGYKIDAPRLYQILSCDIPRNTHELHEFLNLIHYFRAFLVMYADLTKPLHDILQKGGDFSKYTGQIGCLFLLIRRQFMSEAVLKFPKKGLRFHLVVFASNVALTGLIFQIHGDVTCPHLNYCASRVLLSEEMTYTMGERELLGARWMIAQFFDILHDGNFVLYVDKKLMDEFVMGKNINPMVSSWMHELDLPNRDIRDRSSISMMI